VDTEKTIQSTDTTQYNANEVDWLHQSDNEIDNYEVRSNYSQMNLTNWLKSWGQNNTSTGHTQNNQSIYQAKNSNKSIFLALLTKF
jgi:hypothetical protein